MAHTLRIWPAVNPVQESLFVQEKVAGQYALKVQLLKEIAGGHGHLTERILRIAGFPACENFACFSELLLVEEIESSGDLWYRGEGWGAVRYFPRKADDRAQAQLQREKLGSTRHLAAPFSRLG